MNFTIFTTATNYSKMQHLKMKAQRKMSGMSDPIKETARDNLEKEKIGFNIQKIVGKLKAGLKLSGNELEYLRIHSPETYEKAIKVMQERDEYKKKLSKCETKEAVEKIRMSKLQEFAAELQGINDSDLGEAEKLKQVEFVEMKMMGIISEHTAFITTMHYQQLPQDEKERREKGGKGKIDSDPLKIEPARAKHKDNPSQKPENIPYDDTIKPEKSDNDNSTADIFHNTTSSRTTPLPRPVPVSGNKSVIATYSKTAAQPVSQIPTITKTV